jgi:hypothetical protein
LLPASVHSGPIWIEVNVDFVEVQSHLARSEVVDQTLNRSQPLRPTPFWPGAVDGRFGPTQPNPQPSQESTNRGHAWDALFALDPANSPTASCASSASRQVSAGRPQESPKSST